MPTKQGDTAILDNPIAQELLHSKVPARLAYIWPDGTPRVVPIWFHWNKSSQNPPEKIAEPMSNEQLTTNQKRLKSYNLMVIK